MVACDEHHYQQRILNNHLLFPDPHKGILCQIGGDACIPATIIEISSDIIKVKIEKDFKLFFGHGFCFNLLYKTKQCQ